jgi:aspartate carbamoyltransferase catalytic subunit
MSVGLLGIEELTRQEVEAILQRARFFQPVQTQPFKKLDTLRGKMIVNLFFEASTRTRTSFEIAAKRLGADTVSITASGSSVSKGESLVDTLNTLAAMHPDAIVMRHAASGAPHFLARHLVTLDFPNHTPVGEIVFTHTHQGLSSDSAWSWNSTLKAWAE